MPSKHARFTTCFYQLHDDESNLVTHPFSFCYLPVLQYITESLAPPPLETQLVASIKHHVLYEKIDRSLVLGVGVSARYAVEFIQTIKRTRRPKLDKKLSDKQHNVFY